MRFRRTTGGASTSVAVGLYRSCCCCCWSGVGSLGTDFSGWVVAVVVVLLVLEIGDNEEELEAEVDEGDEAIRSLMFVIVVAATLICVY